ncbi:MAG: hypothetical protein KIT34_00165 [Cyanobacteria bacterium TGS_CYA1]|nr:hypothetical protein [Cyanobacteria bacterium TGS_CYA1]
MKSNIKIVLISAHIVFAAYFLMYCLANGYLVPLLNKPVFRLIALVGLSTFVVSSLILAFLPDKRSIWKTLYLLFYVFLVVIPNVMIPAFGPAVVTIVPFGYYETLFRDGFN